MAKKSLRKVFLCGDVFVVATGRRAAKACLRQHGLRASDIRVYTGMISLVKNEATLETEDVPASAVATRCTGPDAVLIEEI